MKIKFILGLTLLCATNAWADSWRILFYMDASDDLSDMAFKSITEMMRSKSNDSVSLFIQLHAYNNVGLRYKRTNQGLLQFVDEVFLTGDSKQDFINAAAWGFANQKADHTMVIFSNHGWGILDPRWNEETEQWEVCNDEILTACPTKRAALIHYHERHKGYMFNGKSHTYLTNKDLIESLNIITRDILHQRKIDVIAFDTCMGAMIEGALQLAPFANFMLGSQSCSLKDGFDYLGVMQVLNNEHNKPIDIAAGMVKSFDAYYNQRDRAGIYTHAAIDLAYVEDVVQALNAVVDQVLVLPNAFDILNEVRAQSPRFCMWPMYTDLIEFCKILREQTTNNAPAGHMDALNKAIKRLIVANARMIIARCGGHRTKNIAYGLAIYCPFGVIDSSYEQTLFVQKCSWINLLKMICSSADYDSSNGWSVR